MEEETTAVMAALSAISAADLTTLTHSILSHTHHHRRRLSAVLSSPTLFSLTLHHLLSLSLPSKTLLISSHLLSLLRPLISLLHHHQRPPPSPDMRLRDLDAVLLLLFLCETHQLDPGLLYDSPDRWRETFAGIFIDTAVTSLSGVWTCRAGVLIPYIEKISRCRRFVGIMGGDGNGKEGTDVAAARAAVVALPAVEVPGGGGVECVICKEEMRGGRDVCEMPCKHLFHWICILPWLRKTNTCPSCRFQLPTDDVYGEIRRLWGLLLIGGSDHQLTV